MRRTIIHAGTMLRFIEEDGLAEGDIAFATALGQVVQQYMEYVEAPRH